MECIISLINTSDAHIFTSFFRRRHKTRREAGYAGVQADRRCGSACLDGTRILIGMRLDLMHVKDREYVSRGSSAVCTGFAVCAPTLQRISAHQTFILRCEIRTAKKEMSSFLLPTE